MLYNVKHGVTERRHVTKRHQLNIRVGENIYKMLVENVQMVQEELDKVDGTKVKYDMSKCIRDAIINQNETLCEMRLKQKLESIPSPHRQQKN